MLAVQNEKSEPKKSRILEETWRSKFMCRACSRPPWPQSCCRTRRRETRLCRRRFCGAAKPIPESRLPTNGGWHSTRDFAEWSGPHGRDLVARARSAVTQLTRDRLGRPVKPNWIVEAWANVNQPGSSNACHYHPGSFWSASYYVDDGHCLDHPEYGGEFEMMDPRGPGPMMHAPMLKFAGDEGTSAGSAHTIRPRPGLLFVFPSFLLHSVRPYRGDALRISVALNFGVDPVNTFEET